MRLFLFTVIVSILFSCNSDLKEETIYHPNGKIHRKHFLNSKNQVEGKAIEYDKNGSLSAIYQFKEGVLVDSLVYFEKNEITAIIYLKGNDVKLIKNFENEKLVSIGIIKNGKKNGKWNFYKNEKISKIVEYIDLCGVEYLNQGWIYDDNGNLNLKESNFIEISSLKKSYKTDEPIKFKIKYNSLWKNNSFSIAEFHPKIDNDFCNLEKTKKDVLLSNQHVFEFSIRFAEKGKKNIRGVIREILEKKDEKVRELYFDIPIIID